MNFAIISVGSNINPKENVTKARELISKELELIAESKFVFTKPIGLKQQSDFLNGAFLVSTMLDFDDLNEFLKEIEKRLRRVKTPDKNSPRTIDLDIITWNSELKDQDVFERDFLKNSVKELLPELEEKIGKVDWENIL